MGKGRFAPGKPKAPYSTHTTKVIAIKIRANQTSEGKKAKNKGDSFGFKTFRKVPVNATL